MTKASMTKASMTEASMTEAVKSSIGGKGRLDEAGQCESS